MGVGGGMAAQEGGQLLSSYIGAQGAEQAAGTEAA